MGVSATRTTGLDVLRPEGRLVCGKHSGQREASKWELRVSLKYNVRERGLGDLQLCPVWKLGRGGGGDGDENGNQACRVALAQEEPEHRRKWTNL